MHHPHTHEASCTPAAASAKLHGALPCQTLQDTLHLETLHAKCAQHQQSTAGLPVDWLQRHPPSTAFAVCNCQLACLQATALHQTAR